MLCQSVHLQMRRSDKNQVESKHDNTSYDNTII